MPGSREFESRRYMRQQFRRKAFRVLLRLSLADWLAGLTPSRLTNHDSDDDMRHLNRHALYVTAQYGGEARAELLADLVRDVTAGEMRGTQGTVAEVSELLDRIRRHDRRVVQELRDIAAENVRSYYRDPELRAHEALRQVIALTASDDPMTTPREALAEYYAETAGALSAMYATILEALGRVPLERLGDDPDDLAIILMALADGLVMRARADPHFRADRYFATVIVPIFMALTTTAENPTDSADDRRVWPSA